MLAVATSFLAPLEVSAPQRCLSSKLSAHFYLSTVSWATHYFQEYKRHYYVGPTLYLDMISTFLSVFTSKSEELHKQHLKLVTGYNNLIVTERAVEDMKTEQEEIKPLLKAANKETEEKMVFLQVNSEEADAVKRVVQEEEKKARKAAQKAEEVKSDCDVVLAETKCYLDEAENALKVLTKDDISKIKRSSNPPALIKSLMEAVCILLGVEPVKKQNPNTLKMEQQWWEPSLKVLSRTDLIKDLEEFKKEEITAKQIKQLQKFVKNPDFTPENMKNKVSSATAGLCSWVLSLEQYYHVYQGMLPKLADQQEAEEEYNVAMGNLQEKQTDLKRIMDKLEGLQLELQTAHHNKEQLETKLDVCNERLCRAKHILENMNEEKEL